MARRAGNPAGRHGGGRGGVTYDGGFYGATKTQDTGARGNMGPGTADVYTVPADPRIPF